MNIATVTAAPTATATTTQPAVTASADPASGVPPSSVSNDDGDGDGASNASGANATPAFDRILSERMGREEGSANADSPANGSPTEAAGRQSIQPDSATDLAAKGVEPGSEGRWKTLDGWSKDTTDRTSGTDATKDAAKGSADGGTPGDDLAAQLALVSQWAALVTPRAAPAAAAVAEGQGDPLAIRAKVDTVRGAAKAQTNGAATGDVADAQGAASRLASTGVLAADRGAPTTRGSSPDAPGVIAAAQADGATRTASELASGSLERLGLLAAGTTAANAGDAGAVAGTSANAFASQMSTFSAPVQAGIASSAPTSTDALRAPVGTPAWSHEVGQATLRMATNDLQNVSLQLNPEHLGPLDVQMRLDNGVAHLQFAATHADTRQALESSRTTLDQMFSDQGLKLGGWSVGHSPSGQSAARDFQAGTSQGDGGRRGSGDTDGSGDTVATVTTRTTRALGLVDTFA